MKTKTKFLLAALVMLFSIGAKAQSGSTPIKGDVNGDGVVDVADIIRASFPHDVQGCRKDFVFCDAYRSCHNDCSVIFSAKVEKLVVMSKHYLVETSHLSTLLSTWFFISER